jgi:hypothetical protein
MKVLISAGISFSIFCRKQAGHSLAKMGELVGFISGLFAVKQYPISECAELLLPYCGS